jgi:hypothetical protein
MRYFTERLIGDKISEYTQQLSVSLTFRQCLALRKVRSSNRRLVPATVAEFPYLPSISPRVMSKQFINAALQNLIYKHS